MKKILAIALCFLSLSVYAQKDFEGIISYGATQPRFESNREEPDSFKIDIYFGKNRMLVKNMDISKEDILILVDSAKVYRIDKELKNYSSRQLTKLNLTDRKPEIIAGYSASPLELSPIGGGDMMGSVFWFADSLFYHMPRELEGNEDLIMVKNNKILLKLVVAIRSDENEEKTPDEYALTALKVTPMTLDPKIFEIPAGYIAATNMSMVDSAAAVYTDTTAVPVQTSTDEVQPAKPAKTPSKTPAKNNAAKPPIKKHD